MIAEGSSSSSSPTPVPGGGPPHPDEPDLLAERRARRIADSGEAALLRRAQAAEATVKALETNVLSLQQRLREAEGDTRRTVELAERLDRVESALDAIRESHRRMAVTIGELRDVALRLRAAAEHESTAPLPRSPDQPRREEMADALAAAVERLRARAQESSLLGVQESRPPGDRESRPAERAPGVVPVASAARAFEPVPHKHAMSLIARLRNRRKQRKRR